MCKGGDDGGYEQMLAAQRAEEARIKQAQTSLANYVNSAQRQADIGDYTNAYNLANMPSAEDLMAKATTQARQALARSSGLGSSLENDVFTDLAKNYDKLIVDIGNAGISAGEQLRQADQSMINSLNAQISSGMTGDAALSAAQNSMSSALNNARANMNYNMTIADLFKGIAFLENAGNFVNGAKAANATLVPGMQSADEYNSFSNNAGKTNTGTSFSVR